MSIYRIRKHVRLLGKSEEMAIVRVCKEVRLLGKSGGNGLSSGRKRDQFIGEKDIVRLRKDVRLMGKWLE